MNGDRRLQTVRASDGRTLAFAEWGDPEGSPVFMLHGTPGCRLSRHPKEDLVRSTGSRVITYDRPGYGASDRQPGRTVADCAADVTAIADALGIQRFAVRGGSGGGPHALAVAALLGDRVTRAACLVGAAPIDAFGDDDGWLEGMDPENVKEFGWARQGEAKLVEELTREDAEMRERVARDPKTMLGAFRLPQSDLAALAKPERAAVIRETVAEETRNGVWGWVDDDFALLKPWGFDVASIRVPVAVWYGSEDVLVPPKHGEWLARNVPNALVRVEQNGHLGDPDRDLVELHAWLIHGRDWS